MIKNKEKTQKASKDEPETRQEKIPAAGMKNGMENDAEAYLFPVPGQVLIISDTHGLLKNFHRLMKLFPSIRLLVHLGDIEKDVSRIREAAPCPVVIVSGNCDWGRELPSEKIIQIGKYRAFLTHGHMYGAGLGYGRLTEAAKKRNCSIAMCGHTHSPVIREESGIMILNPGSLSLPRPAGTSPSYILMDFDRQGEAHYSLGSLDP